MSLCHVWHSSGCAAVCGEPGALPWETSRLKRKREITKHAAFTGQRSRTAGVGTLAFSFASIAAAVECFKLAPQNSYCTGCTPVTVTCGTAPQTWICYGESSNANITVSSVIKAGNGESGKVGKTSEAEGSCDISRPLCGGAYQACTQANTQNVTCNSTRPSGNECNGSTEEPPES